MMDKDATSDKYIKQFRWLLTDGSTNGMYGH